MTAIVSAAEAAGWAATVVLFARLLRNTIREGNRNEALLRNQLLHAVGKPWEEAPADEVRRLRPVIEDDGPLWASPEQHQPIV